MDVRIFGQIMQSKQCRHTLETMSPTSIRGMANNELGPHEDEIGLIEADGIQSELENLVNPISRLCFFLPMSGG
jgi:hypothetical protein